MAASLTADEVAAFREQVAAGRRPRVVFTEAAGQVAGQLGQVVGLLDPAEADEFVVVRFGKDELPFSPGDLRVAPRGAAARKPKVSPVVAEPVRAPEPEFLIDKPVPPKKAPPAVAAPPAAGSPVAAPAAPTSAAKASAAQASAAQASAAQASAADARAADGSAPVPAPRKAMPGRAGKPKPPAGLTVTLAYADGEWTVAATQGAKSLARPYVVRPAEALKIVALVDVPGVREAVEQILAAERSQAQQQADRLRAQLAEVEARLAELQEAR